MNLRQILQHPLLKGGLIYALTDAINKAVPFLILPLLTFYLTPSDYGVVANYTVYTSILLVFAGINLHGTISVNFYKFDKEQVASYIYNLCLILTVSTVICFVAIALGGDLIRGFLPINNFYLLMGVMITLAQVITLFNMELWRLEEKPLSFGVYQITQTLLNFLLTLVFVISLKYKWEGRVWAIALSTFVYGIFSLGFIWRRGYLKPVYNKAYIKDALGFGLPLLPHAMSIWVRTGIDRVFLTKFYGTEATGLYATGFQFGLLLSFMNLAFNNAYIPYLYKNLGRENNEPLKRKLVFFTYAYGVVQVLLALILIVVSYFIVDHFLSKSYTEARDFISWSMFTQVFQGMYLMVACYYFYAKKTKQLAYITFSAALVQVGTSYYFIRHYGPIGAAYSATIIAVLTFVAVLIFSNKVYRMPWLKPSLK